MHKTFGRACFKWLWCSWAHKVDRCYPEVWKPDSTYWHCTRCHPCSNFFEYGKVLATRALKTNAAPQEQVNGLIRFYLRRAMFRNELCRHASATAISWNSDSVCFRSSRHLAG